MANRSQGGDDGLVFICVLAIHTENRKQTLEFLTAQKTCPLRLYAVRALAANNGRVGVQCSKCGCHRLIQSIALCFVVGLGRGLSVIGIYPDFVVSPGSMVGGAPQPGDGVVDSLQCPVGEQ